MDIERLKEIRDFLSHSLFCLGRRNGKTVAIEIFLDIKKLIDEAIAHQSDTIEEVQEAIDTLQVIRPSEKEIQSGEYPEVAEAIDIAITALQAYQPTIRKNRAVEEVISDIHDNPELMGEKK